METMGLAAQHRDLMSQHQDLHLVRVITAHDQDRQVQQLTQDQLPERQGHGLSMTTTTDDSTGQNRTSEPAAGFRTAQTWSYGVQ